MWNFPSEITHQCINTPQIAKFAFFLNVGILPSLVHFVPAYCRTLMQTNLTSLSFLPVPGRESEDNTFWSLLCSSVAPVRENLASPLPPLPPAPPHPADRVQTGPGRFCTLTVGFKQWLMLSCDTYIYEKISSFMEIQ